MGTRGNENVRLLTLGAWNPEKSVSYSQFLEEEKKPENIDKIEEVLVMKGQTK